MTPAFFLGVDQKCSPDSQQDQVQIFLLYPFGNPNITYGLNLKEFLKIWVLWAFQNTGTDTKDN